VPDLPPALSSGLTPVALLRALGRRWLVALVLGLLVAGAVGAGLWLKFPPQYVAEVRLQISDAPPKYITAVPAESTLTAYLRTQAAVVKSAPVLQAALLKPQVADLEVVRAHADPFAWLLENLTVDFTGGQDTLRVSLSMDNPEEAATLVNAVVQAYFDELHHKREAYAQQLQKTARELQDELTKKRERLPAEEVQKTQAEYQRARVEDDRKRVNEELNKLRDDLNDWPVKEKILLDTAVADYLKADTATQTLQKSLAQIEEEIPWTVYASVMGERDPHVKELSRSRELLQGQLLARRQEVEKHVRITSADTLKLQKSHLESQITKKQARLTALEAQIRDMDSLALGTETPETAALRDDINSMKDSLQKVQAEVTSLQVQPADATWITALGKAQPPTTKTYDRTLRMAGLAAAGALALVLLCVAFLEYRRRPVAGAEDVLRGLGIGVVSTLPKLPARVLAARLDAPGAQDGYWQARLGEAVDTLRTFLLRAAGDGPHVVLVTSAAKGEGKTTLASHLAASLAWSGRRTLLVDGDLRKPAAHTLFGLPPGPGFSEVLRGEAPAGEVIRPTAIEGLWILPAGQWDRRAIHALAQEETATLFRQLREEFDYVVVDSSPVLPVADALILGEHADAVLFSVLEGTSRLPAVNAGFQRLEALSTPVLGAVVTGRGGDAELISIQYPARPEAPAALPRDPAPILPAPRK
jgi:capsular exopolysaccharide synthesis family protein